MHVGAETRVDEDSPFGHGAMSESDGSCHGVEMARCGEDGCNDSSELGNGGLLGIGVKLIDGQTLIGQVSLWVYLSLSCRLSSCLSIAVLACPRSLISYP